MSGENAWHAVKINKLFKLESVVLVRVVDFALFMTEGDCSRIYVEPGMAGVFAMHLWR